MAHTIETMVVEGREGKTRSQQLARLAEWKKAALANGADSINSLWQNFPEDSSSFAGLKRSKQEMSQASKKKSY